MLKSFFDFNGDALKLSAIYFSASVFLVQVVDISNFNGFSAKIVREGELIGSSFIFQYIDSHISIFNQITNLELINSKMCVAL